MADLCPRCQAPLPAPDEDDGAVVCQACGKVASTKPSTTRAGGLRRRRLWLPTAIRSPSADFLLNVFVWVVFWMGAVLMFHLIGIGTRATFVDSSLSEQEQRAQREKFLEEFEHRNLRHLLGCSLAAVLVGGAAAALGSRRAGIWHWLPLAWGTGVAIIWLTAVTDPEGRVGTGAIGTLPFALITGLVAGSVIGLFSGGCRSLGRLK